MVTKICELCCKEFNASRPQVKCCNDVHTKTCEVCGQEFEISWNSRTRRTCSRKCKNKLLASTLASEDVRRRTAQTNMSRYGTATPGECEAVKEKVRQTSRSRYGTDYAIQNKEIQDRRSATNRQRYGVDHVFSNAEVKEKIRSTMVEKYGVENPGQSADIRSRVVNTVREKYGVDNVMQNSDIKAKAAETCMERYGVAHPAQNSKIRKKMIATNKARYGGASPLCAAEIMAKAKDTIVRIYGTDHPMQNDEVKAKQADTCSEKYGGYTYQSEALRKKAEATCVERYGVPHPMQNKKLLDLREAHNLEKYGVPYPSQLPETHTKAAQTRKAATASDGTHVDSTYEARVYDFFLRNGIEFEYQAYQIEYEFGGEVHRTTIDFKVGDLLFEVKGGHLLGGCFDRMGVPIDVKLNVYKRNHVIVISDDTARDKFGKPNSTSSNGLKYLNKCPEPLIGVDIALFDANPEFPYRDDRPKCFYNVRVDGQRAASEAFYDESLRWQMINNRIMYSGGFIDNKQILNALNITRTCKQPSWFSKNLAKDIISKYCTSDVIVDTMAGWGTRCDAAIELGKTYIGIDFNKELVSWHQSRGRIGISYGDANTWTYDERCSVFICPPYSDPQTGRCFEDYNFEGFDQSAKALSQCDWLKIVMKNVPNADQYVMVCKILDDGWEKFVVDTKKNRSHFGTNNEYVIVVPQELREELLC